ncbi:MAG: hypothetical protein ACJ71R_21150 [Nitrososphaeraceae archaeon]
MMKVLPRERKNEQEKEEGKEVRASVNCAQAKPEIHLIDKLQQQQRLQTKVSILIVDSKVCLVEDLKVYDENNNNNNSPDEALRLATYSNSESTVLTYISIFETLWRQTELKIQGVR